MIVYETDVELMMNRVIPAIAFSLLVSCSCQSEKRDFQSVAFTEGDLAFRKGKGAKSEAVFYADTSGIYSHTGIVVRQGATFRIVHITPGEQPKDSIKSDSPEEFWASGKAEHGAVYRLKDASPYAAAAAKQALRILQKGMMFDNDYDLNDSTKMYCTEFVWYAYKLAGKDITFGKRSELKNFPMYSGIYIFPSDIYRNDEFQLVYKF